MKSENSQEAEIEFSVEVKEGDKIIAYCSSCKKVIFKGNDDTIVKNRILRRTLNEHLDFYDWEHVVDVVYINRNEDAIIDAEIFLSTGARLTAREGLKDLVRCEHRLI